MKLKMKPIILLDIITLIFLIQFKVFECFSIENDSNIDQNDQNIIDNNQQQQQTQSNRLTTTISVPVNNDDHHQISSALPFKIINSKHSLHSHNHDGSKHEGELPPRRFQIAKFDFEHVSTPYIILLWIIIVGLAKMGFHVTPKLSSICPESVVLMILGVVIGLIMYFAGIPEERLQPLTPNLFFLYMLPPIVMDAGYHMPNRLFFDNLISILLYAVVGTIWNAIAIGFSLYGCSKWGVFGDEEIPFLDIMLFSSTVSAVDPVAVLAVFEEIHVNEVLYILVFGESLLNDGVTVVLYHMFEGYAEMAYHYGIDSIQTIDLISGVASFFVVAIGGTTMGICWGFLAAFVSRFTHHVKIIEPVFVFVMAYLSYLSAEMFHLSGILSLTFCGITMKNYVEENITQKSHTTLKYAMKMLANSSEAIIFVFLGVCTVNDQHNWNTAFVVLTIIFCLVYRTIGVIILTALTNRYRLHKVNPVEQFIMSYGGLRGAVAFALILIINRQIIHAREMMVTTIIAVVYFTVFLQGMTVGTLVKILNVPRANKFELTMNERIHTRLMDHLMAGIEDISGMMMGNYKLRDKFRYYNNRYLRKWLLRDSKEMGNSSRKIFETCSRLDLRDAMTLVSRQQHLMATNNGVIGKSAINTHAAYTNANFVVDEDDYKNNNINGHDSNGGKPTIPRIFLTVPGNPALATNNGQQTMTPILIDPNQSLTTLFRTFTESNLNALYNIDGDNNPTVLAKIPELDPKLEDYALSDDSINTKFNEPKKVDFNYDIGTVVYSPSLKDLKDAELHHILNDAMFKPFKKAHHYSRSDYYEEPKVHPPFQHQVRMQIRKMISERENQRRRRHTHHASYHPCPSNNTKVDNKYNNNNNMQHQTPSSNGQDGGKNLLSVDRNAMISRQNPRQLLKRSKSANEIDNLDNFTKEAHTNNGENNNENNDDDDNDDGITFVAKKKYSLAQDKNIDNNNKSEESKKELIKNFPWNHHDIKSSEQNEDSMTSVDSSSATSHSSNVHQSSQPNNNTKKKKRKTSDVVRQREFPSWIDNRDYVNDYCSPTVTLLERINFFDNIDGNGGQTNVDGNNIRSSSTSTTISPVPSLKTNDNQLLSSNKNKSDKVPSFFEIFNLNKNDIKSIDDETSTESNKPNTNNSKNQSIDQSKISKGSNDTIIEFKKSLSKDDNHYDDDNNDDSLIMISKL